MELYVLSCFGFNHQIRFNSKGEFNIPFAGSKGRLGKDLEEFQERIKDITFMSCDFSELTVGDFIYADPPYSITQAPYNENWDKDQELFDFLDRTNEKGVLFALSNVLEHDGKTNELLLEWSKKYHLHILNYTYSNCNYQKDRKGKSKEVLITNY